MPAQDVDAAYQGMPGAFSEHAARALLGAAAPLHPYPTLDDVFGALSHGVVGAAVVPLHNSLAGPVPRVAALMRRHGARIVAEHVHPVSQAVIGVPGATVASLRYVWSHPVALAQCCRWIAAHPHVQARGTFDTAGAVAQVMARGALEEAAIAGPQAAALYGGVVLAANVHDREDNVTRFALVRL